MTLDPGGTVGEASARFADPLDWLFEEHARHRAFCERLRMTAEAAEHDPVEVAWLLRFLQADLPAHVADEEELVFPALTACALPDDHIDALLGHLAAEHVKDRRLAETVERHLRDCLADHRAPAMVPERARAMEGFAALELHHLALENAVILPLARLRFTGADLSRLADALTRRFLDRGRTTTAPAR